MKTKRQRIILMKQEMKELLTLLKDDGIHVIDDDVIFEQAIDYIELQYCMDLIEQVFVLRNSINEMEEPEEVCQ